MPRPVIPLLAALLLAAPFPASAVTSPDAAAWLKLQRRIERDPQVGGALSLPALGPHPTEGIKTLTRAFTSQTPFVRRQIVRALGELAQAPELSLPLLLAALDDGDARVQAHAVLALTRFGRAAQPALLAELRAHPQHPSHTPFLIAALGLMTDLDVAALIEFHRAALRAKASAGAAPEGSTESAGADALARELLAILAAQDETGLHTLVGFLDDHDPAIRDLVIAALEARTAPADDAVAEALFRVWANPVDDQAAAVSKALLATGPAGVRALRRCLQENQEKDQRLRAAEELAENQAASAAELLEGLAQEPDPVVQAARLRAAFAHFETVRDFPALAPSLRAAAAAPALRALLFDRGTEILSALPASEHPAFITFLLEIVDQHPPEDPAALLNLLARAQAAARPALHRICGWLALEQPEEVRERALRVLEHIGGWDADTRQAVVRVASTAEDPQRDDALRALAANGPAPRELAEQLVREWPADADELARDVGSITPLCTELGTERLLALAAREDVALSLRAVALRALPPAAVGAAPLARGLLASKHSVLAEAACAWLLESANASDRALAIRSVFLPVPGGEIIDMDTRTFLPRAAQLAPDELLTRTVDRMLAEDDYDSSRQRRIFALAWPRATAATRSRLAERLFAKLPGSSAWSQSDLVRTLQNLQPRPEVEPTEFILDALTRQTAAPEKRWDAVAIRPLLQLLARYGRPSPNTLRRVRRYCGTGNEKVRVEAFATLQALLGGRTAREPIFWRALRERSSAVVSAAARALESDAENLGPGYQSWAECLVTAHALETLGIEDEQPAQDWTGPLPTGGDRSPASTAEREDVVQMDKFVVTGSYLPEADAGPPPFPWPPPRAAHRGQFGVDFPAELLGATSQTLGQLHQRFVQALHQVDDRFEVGLFGAPGGFVLLTKLERTDRDGRPLPGARRWAEGKVTPYSLGDLVARLFFEPSGYFREIAFVVTDQSNFGSDTQALPEIASGGDLSGDIAQLPLNGRHVYVLVYAFERKPGGETAPLHSLSASVHLRECGLLAALH